MAFKNAEAEISDRIAYRKQSFIVTSESELYSQANAITKLKNLRSYALRDRLLSKIAPIVFY
ncbi:hypothetical protein [Chlorogloeopsis sp. ULAP02]|uniref:hypothetical protein n=1 Tax=Chlorogloeopsis sp. ULAP02 TaxID=3107926 RepID=UPI003134A286